MKRHMMQFSRIDSRHPLLLALVLMLSATNVCIGTSWQNPSPVEEGEVRMGVLADYNWQNMKEYSRIGGNYFEIDDIWPTPTASLYYCICEGTPPPWTDLLGARMQGPTSIPSEGPNDNREVMEDILTRTKTLYYPSDNPCDDQDPANDKLIESDNYCGFGVIESFFPEFEQGCYLPDSVELPDFPHNMSKGPWEFRWGNVLPHKKSLWPGSYSVTGWLNWGSDDHKKEIEVEGEHWHTVSQQRKQFEGSPNFLENKIPDLVGLIPYGKLFLLIPDIQDYFNQKITSIRDIEYAGSPRCYRYYAYWTVKCPLPSLDELAEPPFINEVIHRDIVTKILEIHAHSWSFRITTDKNETETVEMFQVIGFNDFDELDRKIISSDDLSPRPCMKWFYFVVDAGSLMTREKFDLFKENYLRNTNYDNWSVAHSVHGSGANLRAGWAPYITPGGSYTWEYAHPWIHCMWPY